MAEIEVECFTGVKTAQNNKTEGRIERKNLQMWNWRKMCLGRFYLAKNRKNALWNSFKDDFFAVEPKQLERKRLAFGILQNARPGDFLNASALSLGPRLSLFFEKSYYSTEK